MTTENLLKVSRERTDKLKDKIERLERQNKAMREALGFYGDEASYGESRLVGGPEEPDVEFIHDVCDDNGLTARTTLTLIDSPIPEDIEDGA